MQSIPIEMTEALLSDGEFGVGNRLDNAYQAFRISLVRVLAATGVDPQSGTSISGSLRINRQLAWQLATVTSDASASSGLQVLPGTRGLELFAKACESRCNDELAVAELRNRVSDLEHAAKAYAGDRASLPLFAAAARPKELEQSTATLRRDAYRAQCVLLGIQAATQVRGLIIAPSRSGDPNKVSLATYQCFTNLVRYRRDRPSRLLFIEAPTHDDGTRALGPESMTEHMHEKFALDEELSTSPGDAIELMVEGPRGWVVLKPGETGVESRSNLVFTGSAAYEHPRYRNAKNSMNQFAIATYVPTETIHLDCLMSRKLAEHSSLPERVDVHCFDASTGLPMRPVKPSDPAFLFEVCESREIGPTELACDSQTPNMAEVVARAAKRVSCTVNDLVGVRFTSSFAMSPMDFVISRQLPDGHGQSDFRQ
ncbi:MAG: hypothetical protein AAGB34_01755 [Planctomycetota bacterium]